MIDNTYILDYLISNPSNVAFVSTSKGDIVEKYACAFANDKGGAIVVGMDEQNNVLGIVGDEYEDIINQLVANISPKLPFTSTLIAKEGKNLMVISVWEGNNKPYTASGYFYVRRGDIISVASAEQMRSLFQERENHEVSWERQPLEYATTDDLSNVAYTRLYDGIINRNSLLSAKTQQEILRMMGFLNDGRITNAGIIVLGKTPSNFFSQVKIRVALYDENSTLINLKLYDANLIEAVDELVEYVYNLYPRKIVFNGISREEREALPILAIREGILNAVVHRTYESNQSFMAINIYADRLEIINSGELLNGISLEDFKKEHLSILRNPDIANAFYSIRYIEMAGSGTLRILSECEKAKCDTPFWSSANGMVKLTFPNVRHNFSGNKQKTEDKHPQLSADPQIQDSLEKILLYMRDGNPVKLADAVIITGKSYPTVKRYMQMLKDAGIIEYIGNNRTGKWEIVK